MLEVYRHPQGLDYLERRILGKGETLVAHRDFSRARRIWTMDRGIPTEAVLTEMRESA